MGTELACRWEEVLAWGAVGKETQGRDEIRKPMVGFPKYASQPFWLPEVGARNMCILIVGRLENGGATCKRVSDILGRCALRKCSLKFLCHLH